MIPALLCAAATAATFTANTTNNAGAGSLRDAINNAADGDVIEFDTSVFPAGVWTPIVLTSALPTVSVEVTIRGDQRAELDGSALAAGNGLVLDDVAPVRGLRIQGFPGNGIRINARDLVVSDNLIEDNGLNGIDIVGDVAVANGTVESNELNGNCVTAAVTCAGIRVARAAGAASGPEQFFIGENLINGTVSGHGIALMSGVSHVVYENHIGLVAGNSGHGILVAAATGDDVLNVDIFGNIVANNTGNGIMLGARSSGAEVYDNLIGTDGVSNLGNAGAGIEVFGSDGHTIGIVGLPNVVVRNGFDGITIHGSVGGSGPDNVVVEGNIVGLGPEGSTARGNQGSGIRTDGPGVAGTATIVRGNVSSANQTSGIRLDAPYSVAEGNIIGLDGEGLAGGGMGNGGEGIRTGALTTSIRPHTDASGHVFPNVIGDNEGHGVRLANSAVGVTVEGNWIGIDVARAAAGNAGHGVVVDSGGGHALRDNVVAWSGLDGIRLFFTGSAGILGCSVEANEVHDNTGIGISLEDVLVDQISITGNEITANGACALAVENANNTFGALTPPAIDERTKVRITGTYTLPAGATLAAIEVFQDEEDEAGRLLGEADDLGGGAWEFEIPEDVAPISLDARISATMRLTNGDTSAIADWCNDGCTGTVAGTCDDGHPCTSDTCVVGGCTFTADPLEDGMPCDDGNDCVADSECLAGSCVMGTTVVAGATCNDGNACSQFSVCDPVDGSCDLAGSAVACGDGDSCTSDQNCNPDLGCVNEPRPSGFHCEDGDACTSNDRCDAYANCVSGEPRDCPQQTACNACECDPVDGCRCQGICGDGKCGPDDLDMGCVECNMDTDGDGFPDIWEMFGVDVDCDGDIEIDNTVFDLNVVNLFVEVDFMGPPPTLAHVHEPDADVETVLELQFLESPLGALADFEMDDEIEHNDLVVFFYGGAPQLPQSDNPDWLYFTDIKEAHFDNALRRGTHHYALFAHDYNESVGGSTGQGETPGDDLIVTFGDGGAQIGQQGTLMHELGHNLGLSHGGNEDQTNKPNYQSIMDYHFQLSNLLEVGTMTPVPDYSWNDLLSLDSRDIGAGIDESAGIIPAGGYLGPEYATWWDCFDPSLGWTTRVTSPFGPLGNNWLDFNCNGAVDVGIFSDISQASTSDFHTGWDDWGSLNFAFQAPVGEDNFSRQGAIGEAGAPVTPELTVDEAEAGGYLYPPLIPDRATIYPGCPEPEIPLSGDYVVPLVIYGQAGADDPTDVLTLELGMAEPIATTWYDFDGDSYDDLVAEFDVDDLKLSNIAIVAGYAGRQESSRLVAGNFELGGRVAHPPDADGDDIHDDCDQCVNQGYPRGPDGCPP